MTNDGANPLQIHVHPQAVPKLGALARQCEGNSLPFCNKRDGSGMIHDAAGAWAFMCERGLLRMKLQQKAQLDAEGKRTLTAGKHKGKVFKDIYDQDRAYDGWIKSHANRAPYSVYAKYARERSGSGKSYVKY